MALDIEVAHRARASSSRTRPARPTASSPSRWPTPPGFRHVLSRRPRWTRRRCSRECARLIRERDPDVIEGHNIFRFDLEYLEARARRHRRAARLGPRRLRAARAPVAHAGGGAQHRLPALRVSPGATSSTPGCWRQLYDVGARDLPSFGLKDMARHFGVAAPDRTYLPPEDIPRIFREEPDAAHGLRRATTCWRRSAISGHPVAALLRPGAGPALRLPVGGAARQRDQDRRAAAARVPAPRPRGAARRGRAAAVGGRATPRSSTRAWPGRPARGRDLALPVAHADAGARARLRRARRLPRPARATSASSASRAKRLAREAAAPEDRLLLERASADVQDPHQLLLRLPRLLGCGHWNDFDAANRVTAEGRRLVLSLRRPARRALGATVIEVDTDGALLRARRAGHRARTTRTRCWRALAAGPARGHPARAGRPLRRDVQLQDEELRRCSTSAASSSSRAPGFRSRGIELFQRRWMEEMFRLLLTGRRDEIPALVAPLGGGLPARRVPVRALHEDRDAAGVARAPTARSSQAGDAQRRAPPTSWPCASSRPYQPGDQVSYYVTGETDARQGQRGGEARGRVGSRPRPTRTPPTTSSKLPRALREVPALDRAGRPRRPSWSAEPAAAPAALRPGQPRST